MASFSGSPQLSEHRHERACASARGSDPGTYVIDASSVAGAWASSSRARTRSSASRRDQVPPPRRRGDPETRRALRARGARGGAHQERARRARLRRRARSTSGSPYIVWSTSRAATSRDAAQASAARSRSPTPSTTCSRRARASPRRTRSGIVHRDLKPANLFLTQRPDGSAAREGPRLRHLEGGRRRGDRTTRRSRRRASVFGSPPYMSPEQMRSAKNVDARTRHLGARRHPLRAPDRASCRSSARPSGRSALGDRRPTSRAACATLRPEVGDELEAIVLRCLEKNVKKRFQNVSELASCARAVSRGDQPRVGRPHPSVVDRRVSDPTHPATPSSGRALRRGRGDVGTATERAWTTAPPHPGTSARSSRSSDAALGALVAVGGWYVLLRSLTRPDRGAPAAAAPASRAPTAASPHPSVDAAARRRPPPPSASAGARVPRARRAPRTSRRPTVRRHADDERAHRGRGPRRPRPALDRPNGAPLDPSGSSH